MLHGEFVVNAASTAKHGKLLEAINTGKVSKFADGGIVGGGLVGALADVAQAAVNQNSPEQRPEQSADGQSDRAPSSQGRRRRAPLGKSGRGRTQPGDGTGRRALALSLRVALLDFVAFALRELRIQLFNVLRLRDHLFDNEVEKAEQHFGRCSIIPKVHFTGVDRFVADDPHGIERLLNPRLKAVRYKSLDVSVDVLARLAKVLAQLLDAKPD